MPPGPGPASDAGGDPRTASNPIPGIRSAGGPVRPGPAKKGSHTPRYLDWDWWWDLNKERFLNLKSKKRSLDAQSDTPKRFGSTDGQDVHVTTRRIRAAILPTLKIGLKDPHYDARAAAVIALGKVGDTTWPELIDDIKSVLGDRDKRVRESACLALGILGAKVAIPDLREIVRNTTKGRGMVSSGTDDVLTRTRAFASVAIGLIGARVNLDNGRTMELLHLAQKKSKNHDLQVGPAIALQIIPNKIAIPGMLAIFNDPTKDLYLRTHIGVALGKVCAVSATASLVSGLKEEASFIQCSSAISLGLLAKREDRITVNNLIALARNAAANRGARNLAMMALGEIGSSEGKAFLNDLVLNGDPHDQRFASLALGVLGHKFGDENGETGRLILNAYKQSKSEAQKSPMAIALGLLAHEPARDVLRNDINRRIYQDLRGHLAIALGLLNDARALPAIRNLVKQAGDPDLRKRAAISLGLLRDPEAVEILRNVISEPAMSKPTLGAAAVALGCIGDRSAVNMLAAFVEKREKHADVTRAFAAVALGFLGDKDMIPILSRVREHSNYLVQTEALHELLAIL